MDSHLTPAFPLQGPRYDRGPAGGAARGDFLINEPHHVVGQSYRNLRGHTKVVPHWDASVLLDPGFDVSAQFVKPLAAAVITIDTQPNRDLRAGQPCAHGRARAPWSQEKGQMARADGVITW